MLSVFSVAAKIRSSFCSEKNCCPISRASWLLPHPGLPDKYTVLIVPLEPLLSSSILLVILSMSCERLMISCGGRDTRMQNGWSFALISCVRHLFSSFVETKATSVLRRVLFVWSNSAWRSQTCFLIFSTSFVGKVVWFFISWISDIARPRDAKAFNTLSTDLWKSVSASLPPVIWAISFRTWRISSTSLWTAGIKVVPILSEYRMAKNKQVQSHSAVLPICNVASSRPFLLRLDVDSRL